MNRFNLRHRKKEDLLARGIAILSPLFAGLGIKFFDFYLQVFSVGVSIVAATYSVDYISKFNAPKAFAFNYFKNFVEPVGEALGTRQARLVPDGTPSSTEILLTETKLRVILPKNLSLKHTDSVSGIIELQKTVEKETKGGRVLYNRSGEAKNNRVRFKETEGVVELFDVPNNLNTLRDIQFEDEPGDDEQVEERRASRAKQALTEYSRALGAFYHSKPINTVIGLEDHTIGKLITEIRQQN